MQTQLPSRPYVELPPPPDGFVTARREASRRRARRTVGVVAGGVSAAVVGVVVAVVGGGNDIAVLKPAPVTPATQQPPAPAGPSAAPGPVVSPAGSARPRPGAASVTPPRTAGSEATAKGAPQKRTGEQVITQPVLARTRSSYSGYPRVCRTGDHATDSSVQPGDNWCFDAAATSVSGGERLSLTLCRDSTSDGTLTYGTSNEVDFVVMQGRQTVWRWSRAHPPSSSPHSLSAAADGCWEWSLVWPGRTQSGAAAGHGGYTLVVSTTADQLSAERPTQVAFTY